MANWNVVVSGFNTEEETVNFGARAIAENNGSFYETSTVATIQSNEEITKKPKVCAFVQHSKVCIAIDKSITVFENDKCEDILLSATFGVLVSCYCLSEDGSFLFVVLTNGVLYCLHLVTQGQVIFNKNITSNEDKIVKIFLQEDSNKCIDINLVAKSGAIYRVPKVDTKLIESAIMNVVDEKVEDIVKNIQCTQLFEGFSYEEVVHVAVGVINEELSIAMVCTNMLFMWPEKHCSNFKGLSYKYKKVHFLKDRFAMLGLRTDHMLNIICPKTLLGLKVYNEPVSDFVIIEEYDNLCQIVLLSPPDCNNAVRTLHVISFPEFEQKFQINVPLETYLVKVINFCNDLILYMEGVNDNGDSTGNINTIRIKTISQSTPELQLQRLLRREQFDAAEAFANRYNISVETIYCARAAFIMSQLGPWGKKNSGSIEFDSLIGILDKIQNVRYVVECCCMALVPEYKQMRKIHLYARKRIAQNTNNMENDEHLKLLYFINDALHKLETFHMIWGCKSDSAYYDNDTMEEWIRFSRGNFLDEYKMHLSLGEMEAATLIWSRHHSNMIKDLSVETVKYIFAILPEKMSPSCLWPWLLHFIPTLLSFIPDAMNEIIDWGSKKMKSLEQSHRTEWPQIGIDFGNEFTKLLRFGEIQQSSFLYQEYMSRDSVLKQFVHMMQALSDIQKLKTNYRLAISLRAYIGEPIEVSHILLSKIPVDMISEFVNTFLKQYMLNNSLNNDHVFSSYIQKTIKNYKTCWSGEEAPWEKRVITIITLIHNIEIKLQQTLVVLKKAKIPWSSNMMTLAETTSDIDHALAYKIKAEYNFVPIRIIMKKYGYGSIDNKLISRIIRVNNDDMITHIHQLTRNDLASRREAFASCIHYFLSKGNFKRVMEVLDVSDEDIHLYCCIQIVNYVTACFSLKNVATSLENYVEMLAWVKVRLREISEKCKTQLYHCTTIISTIDDLKSLYFLKRDFHVNITLTEYQINKNQVLEDYIKELCSDIENHGGFSVVYRKAIKVANLLQLQSLNATSVLVEYTNDVNVLKNLTGGKEHCLDLSVEECQCVNKICVSLLRHAKMDANIAAVVKNLSDCALCFCSDDTLRSILLTSIWANLYKEALGKYCSNSVNAKQEEHLKAKYKLYTIYKDLSITGDQLLVPLFQDALTLQISYANKTRSDEENKIAVGDLQPYNQQNTEILVNELLRKAKELKAGHNDYCLLQITKTLYFGFHAARNINSSLVIETKSVFLYFLMTLLRKLILARKFDLQLGLSCLFMLSESEACKWISATSKTFQVDYIRHLKVSELGHEYFRLTNNHALLPTFKDNKALHSWAQKLSKYSISYKDFFTSNAAGKREILQNIMNCDNANILPILQDFCCHYEFEIQDCLLLYLQTLVKTWNPKLIVSTSDGKKELQIHEDEINELSEKCSTVVTKISNKTALQNCITTVLLQINFYHYEVFIILMDLIHDKNEENRNYFCFLQSYTRRGQPTQIELDEWVHRNPGCTTLPPIAEWRLPFLPKVELWKLITPELNLKTYEKWLGIASTLKLQPHIICTLAIKGEITRVWKNVNGKHKTEKWALYSRDSSLLNDIRSCIDKMTGPDALYYGTAALYYVVNHTPPGADQVAASEECYKYSQLSAQKSTALEEGMLEKIKFKYLRFTAEHILRTHGLGMKNYLSLIGSPQKLVHELYTDESIPQRYLCVIDHRPDINSAVSALSRLFCINMVKLRLELLQEWLQPNHRDMKINESITDVFSVDTNSEQNSNYDDNLLRACYILDNEDLESSVNFLINIAFGDTNEHFPEVRYRALHVLQTITDTAKLENLTKRDSGTIRQYMKSLKYISKLESLGLEYGISTFETCSKHTLVQLLWQRLSYSPPALVMITQICIEFEIYDYSLWDKTLTQMAKLLMVNELKKILLQVQNISVVNSNGYLAGWQAIVSNPFRKMDICPSSEQIKNCIEVLRLLYSCNIVHMLQFTEIMDYCFQCKQPHLAVALLPFLNDTDKEYVLETVKGSFKVANVLEDLNKLSSAGILSISQCSGIIQGSLTEM